MTTPRTGSQIRSAFLKYFERAGHTIIESSSLVPHNDPSLLFTNAGMNQFKDVFLGKDIRSYSRATSSQKCVRAGGKHNDLENVGFTARHHTFFEMLGNFSFGDYFKKEAIHFAWEFVTKELGLPKDRLYVSVFEKDDEAAEIWNKQEGVPMDRISRFGEKDNFWSMGDTGPCGPCSEIFIDRGQKYSCGKPTCKMGCDCDRYIEFWNLVFMQFDRDASGKLTPLPKPSVDTGAGLERIAMILQEVDTNYDTDLFLDIIHKTASLLKAQYNPKADTSVSYRVIADHSRASAFLIADGVLPSNEGRGYVLRRIMRRAIRHGKKLGFDGPFLHKTAGFVIEQMKEAYPDLIDKRSFIEKAILAEEEQFLRTLERGLLLLDEEMTKLKPGGTLPGEVSFKLYDTYGFPQDLTRVICNEKGFSVDEIGFEKAMDHQKSESRKHWKGSGQETTEAVYFELARELASKKQLPKFVGYETHESESECVALLSGGQRVEACTFHPDGNEVEAVFAITPFYAESGGQVGDRGRLKDRNGFAATVLDVTKPTPELIVAKIKVTQGSLKLGQKVHQETDRELRALTSRNHTATHLLHWALREVLGKHVKQAGSLVDPDLLRFDFSHFQAMTPAELETVENLINQKIWSSFRVLKNEMNKEAAIAAGAIAFFGEKYGDLVRVVQVGDFSTELCGGTHVDNSSDIHLFKIVSESGIAAGVRRIVAMTSKGAFDYLRKKDTQVKEIQETLRASSSEEIFIKLEKMANQERELKKQVEQLISKSSASLVDDLVKDSIKMNPLELVVHVLPPQNDAIKVLRDLGEKLRAKSPHIVAALGMSDLETKRFNVVAVAGKEAVNKKVGANLLIQKLSASLGLKGGGKPDFAQAGSPESIEAKKLLEVAQAWLNEWLKDWTKEIAK